MRLILIIGLVTVSLSAGCAQKQLTGSSITAQKARTAVLDGYRNDCINEYGYNKEGSDLLAACVQSKDVSLKPKVKKSGSTGNDFSERFNKILSKGSYTFKS